RKDLIVDRDLLGGVLRLQASGSDDSGDRLADETNVIDRKRVIGWRACGFSIGAYQTWSERKRSDSVFNEIRTGEHRDDAWRSPRRRRADRHNARVRMRRAHEGHVHLVGHRDIVDVLARAADESLVFAPLQRLADSKLGHYLDPVRERRRTSNSKLAPTTP